MKKANVTGNVWWIVLELILGSLLAIGLLFLIFTFIRSFFPQPENLGDLNNINRMVLELQKELGERQEISTVIRVDMKGAEYIRNRDNNQLCLVTVTEQGGPQFSHCRRYPNLEVANINIEPYAHMCAIKDNTGSLINPFNWVSSFASSIDNPPQEPYTYVQLREWFDVSKGWRDIELKCPQDYSFNISIRKNNGRSILSIEEYS
ncbi:MAG: hypothetical protein ACMXYC_04605 [Candidatus Woesearchaeota archaeon]